jgi:hypothetical protein
MVGEALSADSESETVHCAHLVIELIIGRESRRTKRKLSGLCPIGSLDCEHGEEGREDEGAVPTQRTFISHTVSP